MKRDMELIRLLLIEQETDNPPPELSSYTDQEKLYNVALMDDAGLIVASFIGGDSGAPRGATILRLTWAGHDFLDATKDSKIWKAARDHIIKPGASWTFQTLLEFLKREIEQRWLGGGPPTP